MPSSDDAADDVRDTRGDARFAIVVHGGAGAIAPERHAIVRASVAAGARAGRAVLAAGGDALDAVVAAVRVLEDDPALNAGRGSVLTRDGTVETDACVMAGADQRVGAVCAVPDLGCAIALARAVLDRGEHVMLAGAAALDFAREVGIVPAAPGALVVDRQRDRLAAWHAERTAGSRTDEPDTGGAARMAGSRTEEPDTGDAARMAGSRTADDAKGTVGAVAIDARGVLASATSTGGMVGKRRGRVGDSPIPGAGTWADARVAISATGDGEAILRVALARAIAAEVARGASLGNAIRGALAELAAITGGSAGVIAIDRTGARATLQLTPEMPVAWADETIADVSVSLGEAIVVSLEGADGSRA